MHASPRAIHGALVSGIKTQNAFGVFMDVQDGRHLYIKYSLFSCSILSLLL